MTIISIIFRASSLRIEWDDWLVITRTKLQWDTPKSKHKWEKCLSVKEVALLFCTSYLAWCFHCCGYRETPEDSYSHSLLICQVFHRSIGWRYIYVSFVSRVPVTDSSSANSAEVAAQTGHTMILVCDGYAEIFRWCTMQMGCLQTAHLVVNSAWHSKQLCAFKSGFGPPRLSILAIVSSFPLGSSVRMKYISQFS